MARYGPLGQSLGNHDACRAIARAGLATAWRRGWNHELPRWQAQLARLALVDGMDPQTQRSAIRDQTTPSTSHLARPDAGAALVAARQALDLATAADCGYPWGDADAAQARRSAFAALGQPEPARRAFAQALAVRERIDHPQTAATHEALAPVAGRN